MGKKSKDVLKMSIGRLWVMRLCCVLTLLVSNDISLHMKWYGPFLALKGLRSSLGCLQDIKRLGMSIGRPVNVSRTSHECPRFCAHWVFGMS